MFCISYPPTQYNAVLVNHPRDYIPPNKRLLKRDDFIQSDIHLSKHNSEEIQNTREALKK